MFEDGNFRRRRRRQRPYDENENEDFSISSRKVNVQPGNTGNRSEAEDIESKINAPQSARQTSAETNEHDRRSEAYWLGIHTEQKVRLGPAEEKTQGFVSSHPFSIVSLLREKDKTTAKQPS